MVSLDGRGKSPFLLAETDLWILGENRETREKENERRKKTFDSEFFSWKSVEYFPTGMILNEGKTRGRNIMDSNENIVRDYGYITNRSTV